MTGKVLVIGGRGALGSVVVDLFKSKHWWTLNVDLVKNDKADGNVLVSPVDNWTEQSGPVVDQVGSVIGADKFDAIFCLAGGWAGGNAVDPDLMRNTESMLKQSVWTSVLAARIAGLYLNQGGLLQLTGASAALEGTPLMLAYGMAKAAVLQLTKSLAGPRAGMPDNISVLAILPMTLDTPMNRKNMPKADPSKWTPLEFVSEKLFDWTTRVENRPISGSLLKMVTTGGETEIIAC